jgi:hypothetical protein
MTFKGLCIDGDESMIVEFEDNTGFQIWQQSMRAIKQEAARIVAASQYPENLTMDDVQAVQHWIMRVDEMVQTRKPVLPSILRARNAFAEAIEDR